MTKNNSLATDLDFIKEYQELKIKQKLLVETLGKKKSDLRSEELEEIISKLEFLVNIFQHASEDENGDNDHFKPVFDKIDKLEKSINDKFLELHEKIDKGKIGPPSIEKVTPVGESQFAKDTKETIEEAEKALSNTKNESPKSNDDTLNSVKTEVSTDNKKTIVEPAITPNLEEIDLTEKKSNELPPPNFKVDDKDKTKIQEGEIKEPEVKKKKHKWF